MSDLQTVNPGGNVPDQVRDQDKIMLVLAYLGILSLIPLLTVKDSDYVKWHAKQGLALLGAWFVYFVAAFIIALIPGVRMILLCSNIVVPLGYLVLVIMGIVKAMQGVRWRIPVVADIADKISL